MENITSTAQLQQYIELLELRKDTEARLIKEELRSTLERLNPVTIIKTTVKDLAAAPDFKEDVMNMLLGLGTGFLSRKIAIGSSHNPIKKLLGTLVQVGITGIVSRNGNSIRSAITNVVGKLFNKKEKEDNENRD